MNLKDASLPAIVWVEENQRIMTDNGETLITRGRFRYYVLPKPVRTLVLKDPSGVRSRTTFETDKYWPSSTNINAENLTSGHYFFLPPETEVTPIAEFGDLADMKGVTN